jgi:hypothetical protein
MDPTENTVFHCWKEFIEPLHSNDRGADPIENSVSIVEICLPSRCLAALWPSTLQYHFASYIKI